MTLEHVTQTERDTLKFRLLAVLAIAISVYLTRAEVPVIATIGLIAGYLFYSLFLRAYLIPRFVSVYLVYGMLVADLATATAALFIFGVLTPLFILLPLVIVYYAIYLGYTGSLLAATLSSFGYVGLASRTGQKAELGDALALQVPLFYIVAILAGYLAQQRFKEREEKQTLQHLIQTEVQARGLLEVVRGLDRTLDVETTCKDIVSMAPGATGIPYCVLTQVDPDRKLLVGKIAILPQGTSDVQKVSTFTEASQGPSAGAQALAQGSPRFISADEFGDVPPWLKDMGMPWLVAAPLKVEAEGLGVLYLFDTQDRDVQEGDLDTIQRFAEIVSRSLNNALLYSQAQSRSARLVGELTQSIDRMGRFRDQRRRDVIRVGALVVDPQKEIVVLDGQELMLPRTEFDLLYVLAGSSGVVVNQETLVREVWGQDFIPQGNIVDVTIYRLRRRLEAIPSGKKLIRTVRGRGYMLVKP